MTQTLVLGVGNTLLTDEGAGVHALHYLEKYCGPSPQVEYLDAGTLSFTLANEIATATNLIILDATELGAKGGTVRTFEGDELDEFLLAGKRSVHEIGFADMLDIARLQDCLPPNRVLIGIQPEDFGWGEFPGKSVTAAIPEAAALAVDFIRQWSAVPSPKAVRQ